MQRSVGILATLVAGVFVSTLAVAGDTKGGRHPGTSASTTGGYVGEHEMTGTVTDVDKDEGRVSLDAEGQKLDLHFPPSALRNVNKGDRVSVRMSIREGGMGGTSGATSMRGTDQPDNRGRLGTGAGEYGGTSGQGTGPGVQTYGGTSGANPR